MRDVILVASALALTLVAGCSNETTPSEPEPESETVPLGLQTPEQCGECHQEHYRDWQGSMHAYATRDPIFVAMLNKGVKDTEGKLDQFCIQCHAPVASKFGMTPVEQGEDGVHRMKFDPDEPLVGHGVVCTTCHTMETAEATLNAQFTLNPDVIQGPTGNPRANKAHPTVRSETLTSPQMCGTCHNVVNPKGALLENTFSEWYASEFNTGNPETDQDCADCHMPKVTGEIVEGQETTIHRHTFVGVDLALVDDFPQKERQLRLVTELLESCAELDVSRSEDVGNNVAIRVEVTNINNGHALPSGSTADRQVWVHLVARDTTGEVVFESGMLDRNGDLMDRVPGHSLDPLGDPDLLLFGSLLFGDDGEHVTFPWQAARSQDILLQPGQTGWREYEIPRADIDGGRLEVEATLRYRTFPPFLVRELVEQGFLEEDAISEIPIIDMVSQTTTLTLD